MDTWRWEWLNLSRSKTLAVYEIGSDVYMIYMMGI